MALKSSPIITIREKIFSFIPDLTIHPLSLSIFSIRSPCTNIIILDFEDIVSLDRLLKFFSQLFNKKI